MRSEREDARYTSPSQLEAERRVIFRRLPFIVGRSSELPEPGSFFTHDAAGVPLLVTRDPWGKVHAMINLCRHRGTRLVAAETGNAKTFVCPYHAWTYDLCGRLGHVSLPQCGAPEAPREDSALVDLPCEVRHGFVWVLPTARAALDLPACLGDLDDELAAFGLADHVVVRRSLSRRAENWKLAMEAFLSAGTKVHTVFPNTVLVLERESASHLALFPHAQEEVTIVHTMLAPREPTSDDERAALDKAWERIDGESFTSDALSAERPIASFHAAIDRAIAAHPLRRL